MIRPKKGFMVPYPCSIHAPVPLFLKDAGAGYRVDPPQQLPWEVALANDTHANKCPSSLFDCSLPKTEAHISALLCTYLYPPLATGTPLHNCISHLSTKLLCSDCTSDINGLLLALSL